MNRRDILTRIFSLPLLWLGTTLTTSCKSETSSSSGAACTTVGASAVVGSNHGHPSLTIPWADIDTAIQQSYPIDAGTAGHTHAVTVSASDMASMKSGSSIIATSTDADGTGHSHSITITCSH